MADLVKRIQSRLSRKSISLSKQDLMSDIAALGYSPQDLQDGDIDTITQLLLDKHLKTELKVSEPEEITDADKEPENASTTNSTAITKKQKEQLVEIQSQSMGINLNEKQIEFIADTVEFKSSEISEYIAEIKPVIEEFVLHRESEDNTTINNFLEDIDSKVKASKQRTYDKLHDGLKQIVKKREASREQTKKNAKQVTDFFRQLVPPLS
ncbi:MAG: hypothetical protein AAF630_01295 [Cyanobacteria bacterium P01_C01_bin.38]